MMHKRLDDLKPNRRALMNFSKLDFSNVEEDPKQLTREFSVQTMANVIASYSDVEETVAVITAWYCLHQYPHVLLTSNPAQFSNSQPNPLAQLYHNDRERFKKRLMLQRALGGDFGDIGAASLEDTELSIEFNFPVHNFLQRLAEYYEIPVNQVKQTFREQLEEAYTDLIETGEGKLKDFGVLYQGEGGPTDLIFDIKDELKVILSSDSESSDSKGSG